MEVNKEIQSIIKDKLALIKRIKKLVESQSKLWQQVPYWSLMAYGKGGFGDYHRLHFMSGVYIIRVTNNNYYAEINLRTGEIDSDDDFLLDIDLDDLNASSIIKSFKIDCKKQDSEPDKWKNSGLANNGEDYRKKMLKELFTTDKIPVLK